MCTVQRRNGVNIKPGRSINSIFPYNDFSLLLPSECSSSPILQYRLAVATTSATLDSSFDILKPIRSGSSLIPTSHCFNSTKRSINRFGQHIFNYNTKWDILGKNQQFFNAISELEILSRQQQRRRWKSARHSREYHVITNFWLIRRQTGEALASNKSTNTHTHVVSAHITIKWVWAFAKKTN